MGRGMVIIMVALFLTGTTACIVYNRKPTETKEKKSLWKRFVETMKRDGTRRIAFWVILICLLVALAFALFWTWLSAGWAIGGMGFFGSELSAESRVELVTISAVSAIFSIGIICAIVALCIGERRRRKSKQKQDFFGVEGKPLHLDFVLVEYEHIPVFFLCRDNTGACYACLTTGTDGSDYIIVKPPLSDLSDMLHARLSMRDLFLMQEEYWNVHCGEGVSSDHISKCPIGNIVEENLPEDGAMFQVLTKEAEEFMQKFDEIVQKTGENRLSEEENRRQID